jgi:hypothetical protein
VVVIAVVAGGSSGSGDTAVGSSTSTSGAPTTTTTTEARRTTTTDREPTTATTAAAPHGPYLDSAAGVQLVMSASGGRLLTVDLTTGAVDELASALGIAGTPNAAQVIGDFMLLNDSGPLEAVSLVDGSRHPIDVEGVANGSCGTWPSGSDRVWLAPPCEGPPARVIEYSLTEQRITAVQDMPRGFDYIAGYVPDLGFVVQAAGGIYVVGPDGAASKIGTGQMQGMAGRSAVRRNCDERLICGVTLFDVVTGEERPLQMPADLPFDAANLSSYYGFGLTPSPTANRALVMIYGPSDPVVGVLDVAAATIQLIPDDFRINGDETVAWSRDGEWLFVQSRGSRTRAYHPADGTAVRFDDLPGDRLLGVKG